MKQDLKEWVDALGQERLIEKALKYLWKSEEISGNTLSAAGRASDFGAGILLGELRGMERSDRGLVRLGKLRNQVRQWRAAKKRSREGGVTRKIFLSREADVVLRHLVGPSGSEFNMSGLVDYLLKKESAHNTEERRLLDNERNEFNAKAAKQAEELRKRSSDLARRAEGLDVREEEIEKWRKLKVLARKTTRDMAVGSEQEITVSIKAAENGSRTLEVSATSGSRKLQQKVGKSASEFLSELLELVQK